MKSFIRLGVIAVPYFAVLLTVAACNLRGGQPAVAELTPINGTDNALRVELADYRLAVARLRLAREDSLYAKPLPPELKDYVLDRLIDERLLQREAERLGVRASTLTVSREMALLRSSMPGREFQRLLVNSYQTEKTIESTIEGHLTALAVLERLTLSDVKVSDADIQAAWEALPDTRRIRPERIRAAQILVATEAEAVKVWRQLRRRGKFAKLAKKHSTGLEAIQGGDLGWFARGELPSVFDEMCFPLKKGYFSHVTASDYGYHICKVLDREPERALSLDELRDELKRELQTDKVRQARQEVMKRLRASVNIVKNKRALARVP